MPLFKSCCFIPLAEARVDVRGIPPRHSRAPSSGGERSGGFSSVRAEGVRVEANTRSPYIRRGGQKHKSALFPMSGSQDPLFKTNRAPKERSQEA
jgi:hypothetical protein